MTVLRAARRMYRAMLVASAFVAGYYAGGAAASRRPWLDTIIAALYIGNCALFLWLLSRAARREAADREAFRRFLESGKPWG